MSDYILNSISPKQQDLVQRIMNLAIGRVFKNLHSTLSGKEKLVMEKIFESGSAGEKEKFMKRYLPNFENAYREELGKLEGELRQEM